MSVSSTLIIFHQPFSVLAVLNGVFWPGVNIQPRKPAVSAPGPTAPWGWSDGCSGVWDQHSRYLHQESLEWDESKISTGANYENCNLEDTTFKMGTRLLKSKQELTLMNHWCLLSCRSYLDNLCNCRVHVPAVRCSDRLTVVSWWFVLLGVSNLFQG